MAGKDIFDKLRRGAPKIPSTDPTFNDLAVGTFPESLPSRNEAAPTGTMFSDLWQSFWGGGSRSDMQVPMTSVPGYTVTFGFPVADSIDPTRTLLKQPIDLESIRVARSQAQTLLIDMFDRSTGLALAGMLPLEMLNADAIAKTDFRPMLSKLLTIKQAMGDADMATVIVNGVDRVPVAGLDEGAMKAKLDDLNKAAAENARVIATTQLKLVGQQVEDYVAEARDSYAINPDDVTLWLKPESPEVAKAAATAEADRQAGGDGYIGWAESSQPTDPGITGLAPPDPDWTLDGLRTMANSGVDIWTAIKQREETYGANRAAYTKAGEAVPSAFDPLTVGGLGGFGFTDLPSWATTAPVNTSTEAAFGSASQQRFQDKPVPKGRVGIMDAINFMVSGRSPAEIKAVRDKLVHAGLLSTTGTTWDDEAQTAWRMVLKESLLQQKQPMDVLMDRAANIKAQSRQVSDPAQLKYQLDGLAQAILGRRLTQGEFLGVRSYLVNLEGQQEANKDTLGAEWFQVNEQNSAAEYLRRTNAVEADKVSRFQTMMQTQEALGNRMRKPKLTHEQQQDVMTQARANGWTSDRTEQYIIEKYVMGWEA